MLGRDTAFYFTFIRRLPARNEAKKEGVHRLRTTIAEKADHLAELSSRHSFSGQ